MSYKYRHRETYKGIRLDIKANTTSELIRKVEKKKNSIDKGIIDSSVKLSEFGKMYLDANKKHSVSASWYQDLCYIWSVITDGIKDRKIEHIKPIHLQGYLNSLTVSDSYIKKQYDLICQVFRYAYINGVTPTDYTLGLVRPHGTETITGRSITDTERETLLKALNGHRGELFCKMMLYCGLRPSEAQALKWADIDLTEKTVTVSRSLKRDGTVGTPKTSAAYRTIPIPDHFMPLIRATYSNPFDDIFTHNVTWRRRMWDSVKRDMNLAMGCKTYRNKLIPPYPLAEDFTLYNLRHTYCTDLEKMGVPINIASRLMGHSNISITSKVYTHASTEALETARQLINMGNQVGKTSENVQISTVANGLAVMRSGVRTPYAPPK